MRGVFLGFVVLVLAFAYGHRADAKPYNWDGHSTRQAGGNAAARTRAGCERLESRRRHFDKSRCVRKARWNRAYRRLSDSARRWLAITGNCESGTYGRYFESYLTDTGNGFLGRYQFSPATARSAGFTIRASRAYYREQDVRAWRWRLRSSASQWPNCAAW